MYNTVFIIIFSIMIIAQIVLLCTVIFGEKTVVAGDVNSHTLRRSAICHSVPQKLKFGDKVVDLSQYSMLVVHGDSMKDYKIHNGQSVFVERYKTEAEKNGIEKKPVVAIKIEKRRFYLSQYKLRKFVSYIDNSQVPDWTEVYRSNKNAIKTSKDIFLEDVSAKYKKYYENRRDRLVLSETYDESIGRHRYSLHSVEQLYGAVKYAY